MVFLEGDRRVWVEGAEYLNVREDGAWIGNEVVFFDDKDVLAREFVRAVREKWNGVKLVAVGRDCEWEEVREGLAFGLDGYLIGPITKERWPDVVREVERGGVPLSPAIARRMMGAFRKDDGGLGRYGLSGREKEVLKVLVKGLPYKQVASELGMAMGTVRTHIRSLYKKLEVHSRTEAVVKYLETGM